MLPVKNKFLYRNFLLSSNNNTTKFHLHLQFLHMPHWLRLALGSSRFLTLSTMLAVQTRMLTQDGLVLQMQMLSCRCGRKIQGSAHLCSALRLCD